MPLDPATGVYYELHGQGAPLMICLPIFASQAEIFGPEAGALRDAYLAPLADRYQVMLTDYPAIGRSRDILPDAMTADRVSSDLLGVASAAGFDRFAFWGYSWGGAAGLQIASRTDRLTALVIGGWSPLGAPYDQALAAALAKIGNVDAGPMRVLRSADQYVQWSQFYLSLDGWDEAASIGAIQVPRFLYFGEHGDVEEAGHAIPIASSIRANRARLEAQGWAVEEIAGHGHDVAVRADLIVPRVRGFLDNVLPV